MKTRKDIKKACWSQFEDTCNTTRKNIDSSTAKFETRDSLSSDTCIQCGSLLFINCDNFPICSNEECGTINTNVIDQTAEWRYYGADDNSSSDPTRCGMPINPLLEESSYGCKILNNYGKSSYEMLKIKRYTEWQSMPYKEKSQYDEFQRITIMAQHSGIAKIIIDDAIRVHKKISEHQTFRGLNRDGIIAASIYISCRQNSFPRTAKEIANMFKLDTTSATKGCKNAITIINHIEKDLEYSDKIQLCTTSPSDFINRYCSKLHISSELTKLCEFIAFLVKKNNIIPENTPHSIAAGIIYLVIFTFELNINKRDLQKVCDISEVTITKCFKKLEERKHQLIPPTILKKYNIQQIPTSVQPLI